mmetsp:Transcript_34116/g.80819  ORF Transcript_34116/g.80819 Transcript_34116/m.80819 type:complete len:203 (-) Transcript_34116:4-612(-)
MKEHTGVETSVSVLAKILTARPECSGRICRKSFHHVFAAAKNRRSVSPSASFSDLTCDRTCSSEQRAEGGRGSSSSCSPRAPTGIDVSPPRPDSSTTIDRMPVSRTLRHSTFCVPSTVTLSSEECWTTTMCSWSCSVLRDARSEAFIWKSMPSSKAGSTEAAHGRVAWRCPCSSTCATSVPLEALLESRRGSRNAEPFPTRT